MGVKPKFVVKLTGEERALLEDSVKKCKCRPFTNMRYRILLLADQGDAGPAWQDKQIVTALSTSQSTIYLTRKAFVEQGFEAATTRKVREVPPRGFPDGAMEARIVQLACSAPPDHLARWTLQLIANQAIELKIVDSISKTQVWRILKKTNFNRTASNTGASRRSKTRNLSPRWKTL
jgi:transposase